MDINKIKFAIFDIDDTLIKRGEQFIKPSALSAIKTLEEKGIQVMIATGRAYYFIHDAIFDDLQPDMVVTINGACVYDKERNIVLSVPQNRDEVISLIEVCRQNDIAVAGKMRDAMHVYHGLDVFLKRYLKGSPKAHILLDYQDQDLGEETPMGMFFLGDETFIDNLRPQYPEAKFAHAYTDAYDTYSVHAGKIKGITQVLSMLNITWDEVIAFGDAENDTDMLQAAKIGVAMGNATAGLKEIADYVTADIDDDGILKALTHFKLI